MKFAPGTDGYVFTAVTCLQVKVLAKAVEGITGTITQPKVIDGAAGDRLRADEGGARGDVRS